MSRDKKKEHAEVCPSCGHCPTCGRPAPYRLVPFYAPYYYPPNYRYTITPSFWSNGTISSFGNYGGGKEVTSVSFAKDEFPIGSGDA